jgi:hypothetical protein
MSDDVKEATRKELEARTGETESESGSIIHSLRYCGFNGIENDFFSACIA